MGSTLTHQGQLCLFDDPPSVESLLTRKEDQWFDRKSIRIEAPGLANALIGFANADGGRIVVGIHNGEIEGATANSAHLNELLRAALDFASPPVRHSLIYPECINRAGNPDRLLVMDVEASESVHRNNRNECYLRVGDRTRLLTLNEERELAFDKGEAIFDGTLVSGMVREDLNLQVMEDYSRKMGTSSVSSLLRSRGLYLDYPHRTGVTQAGWLLLGHQPPIWSYVRYIRYSGTVAETGIRSNVMEDIRLEGTIPTLIEQTRQLLLEKIGTVIRLLPSGKFDRVPVLPEFAWLEAVVNAVTHRSYSLQGDGVRIREFDDRLEIESPGRLPGLVRVQNIQNVRFSRNPHIARVLAEMTGYVRELNEGVRRMFEEMQRYGLRAPVFFVGESSVRVILFKHPENVNHEEKIAATLAPLRKRIGEQALEQLLVTLKARRKMAPREIASLLGVSPSPARNYMRILESADLVILKALSPRDPHAQWVVTDSDFWQRVA